MAIIYYDLHLKRHCFHNELHPKGVKKSQFFSQRMSGNYSASKIYESKII